MTYKELLDLALEALENSVDLVREDAYEAEKLYGNYPTRQGKVAGLKVLADDHEKAIAAIKQARSAPVQEPVGTYGEIFESMRSLLRSGRQADQQIYMAMQHKPLYTSPPAQPAPVQEPVGEVNRYGSDSHGRKWHGIYWYDANVDVPHGTKLYTTPPAAQRQWTGLTDEEKHKPDMGKYVYLNDDWLDGYKTGMEYAEAKLKEKNT